MRNLLLSAPRLIGEPLHPGVSLPVGLSSLALSTEELATEFEETAAVFLAAASSASKHTLKKLRLRIGQIGQEGGTFALRSALSDIGPYLQELVVESESHHFLDDCINTFPIFTSLHSFFFKTCVPGLPDGPDLAKLPAILDALPSPATLSHLSIDTSEYSSLEHISTLLGHPKLASLKMLSFPSLNATPSWPWHLFLIDIAAMAKACEAHGIRCSMGLGGTEVFK